MIVLSSKLELTCLFTLMLPSSDFEPDLSLTKNLGRSCRHGVHFDTRFGFAQLANKQNMWANHIWHTVYRSVFRSSFCFPPKLHPKAKDVTQTFIDCKVFILNATPAVSAETRSAYPIPNILNFYFNIFILLVWCWVLSRNKAEGLFLYFKLLVSKSIRQKVISL